jgi:hypothetical protein
LVNERSRIMKKITSLIASAACAVSVLGTVPFTAGAAGSDTLIYGTMNIPYADFYRAELADSTNAYEVDAVSSATTTKWAKNGEGELFEGTYNEANADGTGTILGVTYPVAITQADLEKLGDNNYGFTTLDSVPAAYKTVTVDGDSVSFSAVQDSEPVSLTDAVPQLSTSTNYGDYLIDVKNTPDNLGVIYGAILRTTDGASYAMRHEENIWRGEFAWSVGFKTTEVHGNTLSYENFTGLMGSTISEIVYITEDGYTTVSTSLYVPVKFDGTVSVESAASGTGKTSLTLSGFPADYDVKYSIASLDANVTAAEISYSNALPGQYTLTVSDGSGKYADVSTSFVLSTDALPAAYADGSLVKAEDADDADFSNFLKNISKVSVNGTEYSATGKGGVAIINEDGTINLEAASRGTNVFDGSGSYEMTVTSTGYSKTLTFTLGTAAPEEGTTAAAETTTDTAETTAASETTTGSGTTDAASTTTAAKTSTTTASAASSPATGVSDVTVPAAVLALSTAAGAFALMKKKK